MKVYLAAPYQFRDDVRECASQLERIGFTVTSTWIREEHEINAGTVGAATALPSEQVDDHARTDFADIERSDLFVMLTPGWFGSSNPGSGGRHVETGFALARHVPVVIVGEPENVFHRLSHVTVVPSWSEAVIECSARLVHKQRRELAEPQPIFEGVRS